LSLIGFLQSEQGRAFAFPPNSVSESFAVPARDLELSNWAWCQCSILRKTPSISSATEHLPKPVSVVEIIAGVML